MHPIRFATTYLEAHQILEEDGQVGLRGLVEGDPDAERLLRAPKWGADGTISTVEGHTECPVGGDDWDRVLAQLRHSIEQNTPLLGTGDAGAVVSGSFGGGLGRFVFGPAARDFAQHGSADKLAQGLAHVDHCANGVQVVPSEIDDNLVFAQDKAGLLVDPRGFLCHDGLQLRRAVTRSTELGAGGGSKHLPLRYGAAPRNGRLAARSASGASYQGGLT